jgi:hypothetical protein
MADQDRKPLEIENLEVTELDDGDLEDVTGGGVEPGTNTSCSGSGPNTSCPGCGPNTGCSGPASCGEK